ncbi:unnamed protein product [Lathyrus sativus]|nr:unnamed protein product [Lathyrus sativus]
MDKLSHMIHDAVENNQWQCLKIGRDGPKVSHLMFADDLILLWYRYRQSNKCGYGYPFFILQCFGPSYKYGKCNIMFSRNTLIATRKFIIAKYGFRETTSLGTYLRVPLFGKSPKFKDFWYLIEKVQTKLVHWKCSQLSFAGRVTLAKAIIEALPTYTMMYVPLPKAYVNKIHQCQRSFIWGDTNDKKQTHSICWSIINKDKKVDGFGLRNLNFMNKSCMAKLGWKLKSQDHLLWSRLLKSKYVARHLKSGDLIAKPSNSCIRNSIVELRHKLDELAYWKVGNEANLNI